MIHIFRLIWFVVWFFLFILQLYMSAVRRLMVLIWTLAEYQFPSTWVLFTRFLCWWFLMKLANIKIKFSDIPVLCTIYIYNAPSLQTESNVSSRSAMIAMPYLFLVIASFIFSTSERIGCDAFLFFCSFREISYTVACLY